MSVEKRSDKKFLKALIISAGVISIGGGLAPLLLDIYSNDGPMTSNENIIIEPEQETEVVITAPTPAPVAANITPPMTATAIVTPPPPQEKPILPTLHDSDPFVLESISPDTHKSLFVADNIVSNFVVFIDNFSRGDLVSHFSPMVKPAEAFSVNKNNGVLTIDNDSYHRYDGYAEAINTIDVDHFINFYTQLTPLIDEAYQEIGYQAGSFNATFEKAIDHLLQTPIIHYQLEVIAPSVAYQYADENLESLPDTQKLMLRMGPDNLQIVQDKLREIKSELQRL